jgi:hypothetical protein
MPPKQRRAGGPALSATAGYFTIQVTIVLTSASLTFGIGHDSDGVHVSLIRQIDTDLPGPSVTTLL